MPEPILTIFFASQINLLTAKDDFVSENLRDYLFTEDDKAGAMAGRAFHHDAGIGVVGVRGRRVLFAFF